MDAALAALIAGYDGLDFVDKSSLELKIDEIEAENLVETDYTASSWQTFHGALTTANGVLLGDDATQDEVDAALAALVTGYDGLEDGVEPGKLGEPGQPCKPGEEQVDSDDQHSDESGTKLPLTATSHYTIMLVGLLLMIFGVATFITFRVRKVNIK